MNKTDLIDVVSDKLGDRRTASLAVEAVVDAITRSVAKGEKVGISGFGVFEQVERAARTARNPTTGEAVRLKKTTIPKFRPGQGFKDIVSGAKKVPAASGDRAVTARAGVPRSSAAGPPARAAARTAKAPSRTAPAAAKAPAKAATRAAKAPATGATTRAAVGAPAGRTVAAPGAARSAAAAKAPGRTAAAQAPAKAAKKRSR